jgi:hypothetical protein
MDRIGKLRPLIARSSRSQRQSEVPLDAAFLAKRAWVLPVSNSYGHELRRQCGEQLQAN